MGQDHGWTLVEMMVAITLCAIGILGTVALIDGASGATSTNKAREGATSLSRELVDVVRSIPYGQLTAGGVETALAARSQFADSSPAPGWTIARRGHVYAVEVSACSLDDPKDGRGPHDVDVAFCADSPPAGTNDRNADDYRRVAITLRWQRRGREERSRQTTVLTNPVGGLGPSVTDLRLTTLASPITDPAVESADFSLTLSNTPETVTWAVNGDVKGEATGSGRSWSFTWPLADWPDGTYIVQAQGFDDDGRSGVARKLTVVLNRRAPAAPGGFAGGRNGTGAHVDLEWHASGEGDVVGYRVYRTDADGAVLERACPPVSQGASAYSAGTSCVDEAAPASGPLHYAVAALDVAPAGGVREGARSTAIEVAEGNARPQTPAGVSACAGGNPDCVLADGTPAPSGVTVVSWEAASDPDGSVAFYRVYRDGTAYAARYGRAYASGALRFVDRDPAGQSHSYRVTAVDEDFGESPQSEAVQR